MVDIFGTLYQTKVILFKLILRLMTCSNYSKDYKQLKTFASAEVFMAVCILVLSNVRLMQFCNLFHVSEESSRPISGGVRRNEKPVANICHGREENLLIDKSMTHNCSTEEQIRLYQDLEIAWLVLVNLR